jgi:serine/threonine-protein phosphatase 2A regulatory subunit B
MTDKTVKLWKIYEKTVKAVAQHTPTANGSLPQPVQPLPLPKMVVADSFVAAQPKKTFANAHAYHINSISVNSDGETFISADDLRVNLWNFRVSDQSFSMS